MEQGQINKLFLEGVVGLCKQCDQTCPVMGSTPELGRGMPHCYVGENGKPKVGRLQFTLIDLAPDLTEEEGGQLDKELEIRLGVKIG